MGTSRLYPSLVPQFTNRLTACICALLRYVTHFMIRVDGRHVLAKPVFRRSRSRLGPKPKFGRTAQRSALANYLYYESHQLPYPSLTATHVP